jgi:hypothetical protein
LISEPNDRIFSDYFELSTEGNNPLPNTSYIQRKSTLVTDISPWPDNDTFFKIDFDFYVLDSAGNRLSPE